MKKRNASIQSLSYQREGTAFLVERTAAGLFDEQGLGKTKQLIDAIGRCVADESLDGAVVVCPNHLKATWKEEIAKHAPQAVVVVLGSGKTARRRALRNLRGMFYIVNYEAVASEGVVLEALLRFKRFALVLDESHRIKSPTAGVTRAILSLRQHATRRYILTGTPLANRPEDLWSQAFFLDGGDNLGTTFQEFARQYGNARTGYVNLPQLNRRLEALSLRRTKASSLKLPQKRFSKVRTPLAPQQSAMYSKMRDETRLWVESMSGEQVLEQADNILKRIVRLVQLVSNPGLIDASYSEEPGKFVALDRLVNQRLKTNSSYKLIIWSSFVDNVDLLRARYAAYGAVAIHGRISRDRRERAVDRFRNDPGTRVLVANPAAAREGLTLTSASMVVYVDRTFSLVDYLQSQDRIHRLGQTHPCEIVLLMAPRTVDEYVDFALEQKSRVAQYVQRDRNQLDPQDALFQKPALISALLR